MANEMKSTRGQTLIRTDDTTPGVVKFYRRDETDVKKAFIAQFDVGQMLFDAVIAAVGQAETEREAATGDAPFDFAESLWESFYSQPGTKFVIRQACHGGTQNALDSSNKLEGQARVDYIRSTVTGFGEFVWASAPIDEAASMKRAEDAIMKMPASPARETMLVAIRAQIAASQPAK